MLFAYHYSFQLRLSPSWCCWPVWTAVRTPAFIFCSAISFPKGWWHYWSSGRPGEKIPCMRRPHWSARCIWASKMSLSPNEGNALPEKGKPYMEKHTKSVRPAPCLWALSAFGRLFLLAEDVKTGYTVCVSLPYKIWCVIEAITKGKPELGLRGWERRVLLDY